MLGRENKAREGYKIWRQAMNVGDQIVYLGEFYPPAEQITFTHCDLKDLGFPPGRYTVLIPVSVRDKYAVDKWQAVTVRE